VPPPHPQLFHNPYGDRLFYKTLRRDTMKIEVGEARSQAGLDRLRQLSHPNGHSFQKSDVFRQFRKGPSIKLLILVDDQHPERTLTTVTDEDAAVTANSDGTLRLKYTEKWAQRKHLRALIRTISLDNEVMHGWLQEKVYGFQGIDDLVKWPLGSGALAAVTLFLAGLLFAIPADRRHAEQRRKAFTADCRTQRQP
jgi:hypothetical protein